MNTDLENALRSIEVARTKLQLLASNSPDNVDFTKLGALLDQAHTILTETPGTHIPAAPPVETTQIPANNQSSDFTLIKKIDPAMASNLAAAGINNFDDIANLRAADVANLTAALSLGTRINRENWIEEAAILAKDGTTAYVRSLPPTRPVQEIPQEPILHEPAAPEPVAPEPVAPAPVAPEPPAPEPAPSIALAAATASVAIATATAPNAPEDIPVAPQDVSDTAMAAEEADTELPEKSAPAPQAEVEIVELPGTVSEPEAPVSPEPSIDPVIKTTIDEPTAEPAAPSSTPPNDRREATVEIKPRTDSQLAYPNSDEDPDQVVKRFMRALTGDNDKDQ